MILTAHQPVFAPYLGTFSKIAQADCFVIFDGVQFERHGYSNRVKIKTNRGAEWLTVPVCHGKPLLKDAKIASGNWARKMCRTIELAYFKAPYFNDYFPVISTCINMGWERLEQLDTDMLVCLLKFLGISTRWERASEANFIGTKSELVLDMCLKMGATKYIFGPMGRGYADVAAFERAGVEVEFQNYQCKPYQQLHVDFIPNLSAIDALFNLGPKARELL